MKRSPGLFSVLCAARFVVGCMAFAFSSILWTDSDFGLLADDTVSATQTADEETIETALNFVRNGEIDQGEFILKRLAGQGNAESLYHLGELFRLGIGREKASDVATMYYRLANALGHKRAALALANFLFFEGDGSEKTMAEALSVWQNLVFEGDAESAYMLGMIYWNGEGGLEQDPVRGYGLVWRAAQSGYADAVQNELTMHSLLNAEARKAAMEYGKSVSEVGFDSEPLALDLVVAPDQATSAEVQNGQASGDAGPVEVLVVPEETDLADTEKKAAAVPTDTPPIDADDWSTVWRLEVGTAMSQIRVGRLQSMIGQAQEEIVGSLSSEIVPSVTRPGLFRLTYGPMKSMQQAVTTCVTLKRAGYECSAKAPEE